MQSRFTFDKRATFTKQNGHSPPASAPSDLIESVLEAKSWEAMLQPLLAGAGLALGLGIGFGTAVAGHAFLREPFDISLEKITMRLPRAKDRLPAEGLRLLHISDLHFQGKASREQRKIERVRQITAELDYDLVIHTGDFLHTDEGLENVLALFDTLPRPRLGTYVVPGNHDYAVYDMGRALQYTWQNFLAKESRYRRIVPRPLQGSRVERTKQMLRFVGHLLHHRVDGERTGSNDVARLRYELERRGVHWLHNSSIHLQDPSRGAVDLYIAGIDDIHEGQPDPAAALSGVPNGEPLVLLCHNPDILNTPAVVKADLLLAGHTHGGQIVLPVVGPAHTQSDLLSRREASGYFQRNGLQIYINRGLGEGIPFRYGAPPHIVLMTLVGT